MLSACSLFLFFFVSSLCTVFSYFIVSCTDMNSLKARAICTYPEALAQQTDGALA